jgi:hypothetical protein
LKTKNLRGGPETRLVWLWRPKRRPFDSWRQKARDYRRRSEFPFRGLQVISRPAKQVPLVCSGLMDTLPVPMIAGDRVVS